MTTRLSGVDLFNMEQGLGDTVELCDLPISGRVVQKVKEPLDLLRVKFDDSPIITNHTHVAIMSHTACYLIERLSIRADDMQRIGDNAKLILVSAGRGYGPWPLHCFYRSVDTWFNYELDHGIFLGRAAGFHVDLINVDLLWAEDRRLSVVLRGKLARPR